MKSKASSSKISTQGHDRVLYLASLIDNISDALISTDMDFTILEWNAAAEKTYGWAAAEVVGHSFTKFVQNKYAEGTTREHVIKLVSEQGLWKGEVTQNRKDGTRFPVMASVSLVKDEAGKPRGFVAINRDITERKRAEEEIVSMARFPSENPNPILRLSREGIVMYANAASATLLKSWECITGDPAPIYWRDLTTETLTSMEDKTVEIECDGTVYSIFVVPIANAGYVNLYGRDITERKRAEKQIVQMKRLYAALSQVNQTIVRVRDHNELYQSICDVAVEFGEFSLAWIGLLNEASGDIQPVAANGLDISQLPFQNMNIHQSDFQDGLIANAFRTSSVSTSEDVQTDQKMERLREQIQKYDYHSLAAVPFRLRDKTIGVLSLVSREVGIFKAPEELKLLAEMGLDISFALDMMQNETERKQAEEALRDSEQLFSKIFFSSLVAISMVGVQDGKNIEVNDAWCKLTGFSREEAIGYDTSELKIFAPEERNRLIQIFSNQGYTKLVESEITTKNGEKKNILITSELITAKGKQLILVSAIDNTERKQAEQSLRESETQLKKSQAVAHIGHWTWDTRTNTIQWSDEMKNIFGIVPEDFDGNLDQVIQNAIHPEDRQKVFAMNEAVLLDGKPQSAEYRIVLKDGSVRHIWAEPGESVQDERGNIIQLSGIVQDITERKHAEETLLLQGMALDTAANAIVITNREGLIEWVNPAFTGLTGYTISEVVGKNPRELIKSGRENQAVYKRLWATILSGKAWSGELVNRRKDGSHYNEEQTITPIVNARGEITHFIAIKQNVTARKQAEEQVLLQLKRLNTLRMIDTAISSSFDMRITLDMVLQQIIIALGVDAAAILRVNLHTQTIEYTASQGFHSGTLRHTRLPLHKGYASRAVSERQIIHIPNLQESESKPAEVLQLANEKFSMYYGAPLIIKGEVKGVLEIYHRSPLSPDAEWLGFLDTLARQAAIAIDNSQLFEDLQRSNAELEQRVAQRTEELHQSNIKLEYANRAKDEFLATMSHELRTPLNSILGLSETLLEQRRDPLSEYQQKSLQIIESSGRHLLDLINDILDLSKIEAGKFDYYPQPINVEEVCKVSLSFIKEQAARKSITINFQKSSSGIQIYADLRRLKQILVNLLTNAVKFTPEHGQISLQVRADAEQDRIQFSVIDNGIGIALADLKQLFVPFKQIDSSLTREHEGTGLGLALVKELTDLHGGSVDVESEVGRGSRFTINLPWGQTMLTQQAVIESGNKLLSDKKIKKTDVQAQAAGDQGLILLAEDNLANILTISDYLETHGYQIIVAHDGLEALQMAKEQKPDVILMDIQMPVMDGLEAIRRLRMDPRFLSTPIIALTALAMPGDRERCLEVGANDYISKPASLKLLLRSIKGFIS